MYTYMQTYSYMLHIVYLWVYDNMLAKCLSNICTLNNYIWNYTYMYVYVCVCVFLQTQWYSLGDWAQIIPNDSCDCHAQKLKFNLHFLTGVPFNRTIISIRTLNRFRLCLSIWPHHWKESVLITGILIYTSIHLAVSYVCVPSM